MMLLTLYKTVCAQIVRAIAKEVRRVLYLRNAVVHDTLLVVQRHRLSVQPVMCMTSWFQGQVDTVCS
jgi:hypothetical protein